MPTQSRVYVGKSNVEHDVHVRLLKGKRTSQHATSKHRGTSPPSFPIRWLLMGHPLSRWLDVCPPQPGTSIT